MGDDGAEVDEAGVCALTGGFVTPEQGAGGLQVDAITYPSTEVMTASPPWLNGRPKPITISVPNFGEDSLTIILHLITQNI